jgi:SH3-like domain-containing protein
LILLAAVAAASPGLAQQEPALPRATRVVVEQLGCRAAPGAEAVLQGRLRYGAEVTVVQIDRPWARLRGAGHEPCWVPMFDVRREVTVGVSEEVKRRNALYRETCPCWSGLTCTGERGGSFCMGEGNDRHYNR